MKNKKALGAIVATSFLIVLTVVSLVNFQIWFQTFESSTLTNVDEQNNRDSLVIETLLNNYIYIKNSNSYNITIKSIKINKQDCIFNNKTALPGITKIRHECYFDAGVQEITLITTQGITSKNVYSKDSVFSPRKVDNMSFWFDFTDISTMYLDTSATIPATGPGQKIALVYDKSGNGLNASMENLNQRPTLRLDSQGEYYLDFDGINDSLRFTNVQLLDIVKNNRSFSSYISFNKNDRDIFAFSNCCHNYINLGETSGFLDKRGTGFGYGGTHVNFYSLKNVGSWRLFDNGILLIDEKYNYNTLDNTIWTDHEFGSKISGISIGSYQVYNYANTSIRDIIWYADEINNETNKKMLDWLY